MNVNTREYAFVRSTDAMEEPSVVFAEVEFILDEKDEIQESSRKLYPYGLLSPATEELSAISYLINSNEPERASRLAHLRDILYMIDVRGRKPWYIQSIDGLDSLMTIDKENSSHLGPDGAELTFKFLDSAGHIAKYIKDAVRFITWDDKRVCYTMPSNMREFRMKIRVREMRYYNDNSTNKSNPSDVFDLVGDEYRNYMEQGNFHIFTCIGCEFDISSLSPSWMGSIDNAEGVEVEDDTIKIKVKDVLHETRNDLLDSYTPSSTIIAKPYSDNSMKTTEENKPEIPPTRMFETYDDIAALLKNAIGLTEEVVSEKFSELTNGDFLNNKMNNALNGLENLSLDLISDSVESLLTAASLGSVDFGLAIDKSINYGSRSTTSTRGEGIMGNVNSSSRGSNSLTQNLLDLSAPNDTYTLNGVEIKESSITTKINGVDLTDAYEDRHISGIDLSAPNDTYTLNGVEIKESSMTTKISDVDLNSSDTPDTINSVATEEATHDTKVSSVSLSGANEDQSISAVELDSSSDNLGIGSVKLDVADGQYTLNGIQLEETSLYETTNDVQLREASSDESINDVQLKESNTNNNITNINLENSGISETISPVNLESPKNNETINNINLDGGDKVYGINGVELDFSDIKSNIEQVELDSAKESHTINYIKLKNEIANKDKIEDVVLSSSYDKGRIESVELKSGDLDEKIASVNVEPADVSMIELRADMLKEYANIPEKSLLKKKHKKKKNEL